MRSPIVSTLVAASLLVSATAASAQPPGPVSARSGADVENPDELIGSALAIVGLVVVLGVIAIFVIFDGDDDDVPTSP